MQKQLTFYLRITRSGDIIMPPSSLLDVWVKISFIFTLPGQKGVIWDARKNLAPFTDPIMLYHNITSYNVAYDWIPAMFKYIRVPSITGRTLLLPRPSAPAPNHRTLEIWWRTHTRPKT